MTSAQYGAWFSVVMKTETIHQQPTVLALQREAARHGPGYKGVRIPPTPEARTMLLAQFRDQGLEPPPFVSNAPAWVDRRAKLFEAGDYPDKGVSVSEEQLRLLERSFDLPVPILIEHARSPLQLGYLTDVRAVGTELFGSIALTEEADRLIEASGAQALSLGLDADLTEIREVSLVKNPRVASARLFTGEILEPTGDWRARFLALEQESAEREAGQRLQRLLEDGRIVPAQVPFAHALIRGAGPVQFDGESVPIATLVMSLLEAGPRAALLSEQAPTGGAAASGLGADERDFYGRYFPGLSLDEIAKHRPA